MSMKASLRPSNPATIWLADNQIVCELPRGDLTHTIAVSNDAVGIAKILSLLAHRTESSRIGEPGEPTQHLINKSTVKPKRVGKKPAFTKDQLESTKEVLRKLGMI